MNVNQFLTAEGLGRLARPLRWELFVLLYLLTHLDGPLSHCILYVYVLYINWIYLC